MQPKTSCNNDTNNDKSNNSIKGKPIFNTSLGMTVFLMLFKVSLGLSSSCNAIIFSTYSNIALQ